MSKRGKKLRNRMARQVLSGKITVTEARARLGRNAAQKSAVQKSALPAWPAQPPPAPRYAGDDAYIRSAFRPIARPAVAKAAAPAPRETPQQAVAVLKSLRAPASGQTCFQPAASLTPAQRALWRNSQLDPDPEAREAARASLLLELDGRTVI
jgi:hypothetical protein